MSVNEITRLLAKVANGSKESEDELIPLVYEELHHLAGKHRNIWNGNDTLNTTALLHEAYIKVNHHNKNWESRGHFFSVASKAMRCILVDHARKQQAQKRGMGMTHKNADEVLLCTEEKADEIIALDDALLRLASFNEKHSKIVEFRFFCGFSIKETADLMETSESSIKRSWSMARSWLYNEMQKSLSI